MVVGIVIVSGLVKALEAPAVELARERFVLALDEVLGYNIAD